MIRAQQFETKAFNGVRPRSSEGGAAREFRLIVLVTLLHLPLGILLYSAGPLAILHPVIVFVVGLSWALRKQFRMGHVALAVGYLIGSEVLWRMAQIPIPWEFGKYGAAIILIAAIVIRNSHRVPPLPLVYFIALLPSCVLTVLAFDLNEARDILSSNLSGPLLLLLSCWFFSNTRMSLPELRRLGVSILMPLISVSCVTLFYTVSTEEIYFTQESNFATSGGFGPNQVSSMLGLGAFVALLTLIIFRNNTSYKIYFALAALLCTAQSVMTFSRGGIYNALVAILAVSLWELRKPAQSWRRLAPVVVAAVMFLLIIFPILNNRTGGSLQERFEDTDTAKREDIASTDIQIFYENPVLGVGVGLAYDYRERFLGYKAMSHTEFSRLLSEHGAFGVVALLSLLGMSLMNLKRQPSNLGRALVIGASAWSVMFMLNAGMRLGAPAFIWGLTFVTIVSPLSRRIPRRPPPRRKEKAFGPTPEQ
ncbi:MAG: O-antigen ligase family protein [Acidobacteriota bacterium]